MEKAMNEAAVRGAVLAALSASQTSTDKERVDRFASHCAVVDCDVIVTDAETGEVIARESRSQVRVLDESGEVRRANKGLPMTIAALISEQDNRTAAAQRRRAGLTAR